MYPNGQPGSGWDSSDAPNSWYGVSNQHVCNRVTVGAISNDPEVVPSDPVMADLIQVKTKHLVLALNVDSFSSTF